MNEKEYYERVESRGVKVTVDVVVLVRKVMTVWERVKNCCYGDW